MLGGIEAGGTKFVCARSVDGNKITDQETIPTTTPKETLARVVEFFSKFPAKKIGLASFGPVDVNRQSPTYGYITNTPKPGWENENILGDLKLALPMSKFAFTTDVNAAAYGELKAGSGKGVNDLVYWTVGTGIGAGIVIKGKILQGYQHPEAGHILVKPYAGDDFSGVCPYHGDCLEGMASGPAMAKRTGKRAEILTQDDPAWRIEAYYLAQACMNVTLTVAPERIILGGGVMHNLALFPMIREAFKKLVNNYVTTPGLMDYIVPIGLKDEAGVIGCFKLAEEIN
ncbi:ROK family protein [Lacticaseibacillus chiayiensis]|uniref:ROK family protein n=1 Tax=Lacticaseibacillus chiayiensis TaxID=2100821 RepID=UPI0010116A8F|nr:ROK family protein [Lacticaseibacillus chiayiensis]QVI34611.1 ROK family protein [Lacticaseibacillus chiayiensis]RXT59006.1 fructokinase [Lacticaseibacillus chiayiensis]